MTILEKIYSLCKTNPENGCLEWRGGKTPDGYGKIKVNRKTKRVHRLIYEEMHGEIPDGMFVCHHCDNIICVKDEHLFLGTHADNMKDMYKKGRGPVGGKNGTYTRPESRRRGTCNGMSKLNEELVRLIRARYNGTTCTSYSLAKEIGIDPVTIMNVVKRRTWKHVV